MPVPPIDPSFAVSGPEWNVDAVGPVEALPAGTGEGFGDMLSKAVSSLGKTQQDAAEASQSLVDGSATDPTQVVMSVERARLAMQMASQIRTKGVEAFQDIFHTSV
jgi:flagellar hook-basal body complex protein FliE